jgi:hypothetical protein
VATRLPLHLDPDRARSCPRRERYEPHEPHAWVPAHGLMQHRAWCHDVSQLPVDELLDRAVRQPPEAERATASHAWQGDEGAIRDDVAAYVASGMPGLSNAHPPEVDPEPSILDAIRACLARRPLLMVHDQATADAIYLTQQDRAPLLGIARLVVDESVPPARVYVLDTAKLAEALAREEMNVHREPPPGLLTDVAEFWRDPDVRRSVAVIVTGA